MEILQCTEVSGRQQGREEENSWAPWGSELWGWGHVHCTCSAWCAHLQLQSWYHRCYSWKLRGPVVQFSSVWANLMEILCCYISYKYRRNSDESVTKLTQISLEKNIYLSLIFLLEVVQIIHSYCYAQLAACLLPQSCGLTDDPKAECTKQDYKQ